MSQRRLWGHVSLAWCSRLGAWGGPGTPGSPGSPVTLPVPNHQLASSLRPSCPRPRGFPHILRHRSWPASPQVVSGWFCSSVALRWGRGRPAQHRAIPPRCPNHGCVLNFHGLTALSPARRGWERTASLSFLRGVQFPLFCPRRGAGCLSGPFTRALAWSRAFSLGHFCCGCCCESLGWERRGTAGVGDAVSGRAALDRIPGHLG